MKCQCCGQELPVIKEWNNSNPPKRGPYRVRCEGANPNAGWRYWTGERWLLLVRTRMGAMASWRHFKVNPKRFRNTPTKHPVLWESTTEQGDDRASVTPVADAVHGAPAAPASGYQPTKPMIEQLPTSAQPGVPVKNGISSWDRDKWEHGVASRCLDRMGVPTDDGSEDRLSLWGRIVAAFEAQCLVIEQPLIGPYTVRPLAQPAASADLHPDYSEMSREALEQHATRMTQMLANDKPRAFWDRYAIGTKSAPSCICCGRIPDEVAIQHAEIPGIVVCRSCHDRATKPVTDASPENGQGGQP